MSKKPLVAIFGCGPSGLLAAHACYLWQVPFVIFSRKQKSTLGGAQFSHRMIPGITDPDPEVMLTYEVVGDADTYHRKVYGSERVPFVSFANVEDGQQVPAWNLIRMYDRLWERYEANIVNINLDWLQMEKFYTAFDLVITSVPAPILCQATVDMNVPHTFKQQTVRISNEALDPNLPDNVIRYDGSEDHSYYRMSRIFGVGSTEWGAGTPTPPIPNLKTVNKPIGTNCDCHPLALRVGRFGTWDKGQLTFHAYLATLDALSGLGVEVNFDAV